MQQMLEDVRKMRDKELSVKKRAEINLVETKFSTLSFAGSQLMGMGATGSTAGLGQTGGAGQRSMYGTSGGGMGATSGGPPRQAYMSAESSTQGFGATSGFGQNQYATSQSAYSHIDETTARGRQQAKVRRLIEQGKRLAAHEKNMKEKAEKEAKFKPEVTSGGKGKNKK